jgi:hypothetical protein
VRAANRATVAIYPIDPRALVGDRPVAGGELLSTLAADTDGFAILTAKDVTAGVQRIVRDTSGYYILTLPAGPGDADGNFHPVEVRARPRGVQIRARKGYWAATPDDLFRLRTAARTTGPAAPLPLPRRASPLIRPWFGVTRGAAGDPHVNFVWEPTGRVPGERARASSPARIVFKALKADGTTIFEGVARPSGPAIGGIDAPAVLTFPAPAGRLRIEMSIEDASSRVLDTDVRDVVVRTLNGPVAIGTPQVLRSRTAREHRLLESDPGAVPVPSREFSRMERLWIRVPVYAADAAPRVSARLLSGIGGAMRAVAVHAASGSAVHQMDLPLAGLPAGEYSVEITASAAGAEIKELLTFRVTP